MDRFNNNYQCNKCKKNFSTKSNLKKHLVTIHHGDNEAMASIQEDKKEYAFSCEHCNRHFNKKFHYNHHLKKHNITIESNYFVNSKKCPLCDYTNSFRKNLEDHFCRVHDIKIKCISYDFDIMEDFNNWLCDIENKSKSRFVKLCEKNSTVGTTIKYECSRSGTYRSKNYDRRRLLKATGTIKINGFCPAGIKVTTNVTNSGVHVEYIETHVGHEKDLDHLFLQQSERNKLAEKISSNVPFETILKEIRNSQSDANLNRIHLITKKDLHNIRASLSSGSVKISKDAALLDDWVKIVDKNDDGTVLFYKPQRELAELHTELTKDDLVLIIMNNSQGEMLKKFGQDCICINRLHDMNGFKIELISLLIFDGTGQGFPCAFLLCNRTDKEVLNIFYKYVRDKCGTIETRVLMSDMTEHFYTSWIEVMGKPSSRLFSTWHVEQVWKNNLSMILSQDKQLTVNHQLNLLLKERNPTNFVKILEELYTYLNDDSETSAFADYFRENFETCSPLWAHSYRSVKFNFEETNAALKQIFLNARRGKRLDKLIESLMVYFRDELFNRYCRGLVSNSGEDVNLNHLSSLLYGWDCIKTVEDHWEFHSNDCESKKVYFIKELNASCNCGVRCADCEVCTHKYVCTCIESSISWTMCKHVHLLCQFRTHNDQTMQENANEEAECAIYINCDSEDNKIENVLEEIIIETNTEEDEFLIKKEEIRIKMLELLEKPQTIEQLEMLDSLMSPVYSATIPYF